MLRWCLLLWRRSFLLSSSASSASWAAPVIFLKVSYSAIPAITTPPIAGTSNKSPFAPVEPTADIAPPTSPKASPSSLTLSLSEVIPSKDKTEIEKIFSSSIEYIVEGSLGGSESPSIIRDMLTGEIVRS